MRIRFFQDLYEQYSRLDFTNITDRPIALAGLEERLARTYETRSAFGVFEVFLHRSILWQRDGNALMPKIRYRDLQVPSWSWMAVGGPIRFTNVPFDGVNWSEDIQSPFKKSHNLNTNQNDQTMRIPAVAEDFLFASHNGSEMILDQPGGTQPQDLKCVVVATEKVDRVTESQKYYVLLVRPSHPNDESSTVERVGVAFIRADSILKNSRKHVEII